MDDNGEQSESSLREVDPSPMQDSHPDAECDSHSSREHTNIDSTQRRYGLLPSFKLGLRGHSWEYWLSSIQYYSTYPPTLFLGLHLTNTSLIPLATGSIASSETFLLLTRPIYQSPSLEPLLVTFPILAHITSGIALRYLRQYRRGRLYGAETREQRRKLKSSESPLSVQARLGYALVPLLGIHVLMNRLTPLSVDGGSSGVGLGYAAHGIAKSPWAMRIGYVGLVGVGVWHFVGGCAWWLGWRAMGSFESTNNKDVGANGGYLGSSKATELYKQRYKQRKQRRWIVNGVSVAVTALWLAGGLGVIGRGGSGVGWEAKSWDAIYSQIPVLGRFLVPESA